MSVEWFRMASSGPIVRRGLAYAVVVGSILIAINHGDALLAGDLTPGRWLRMALTVLVPYCVSVFSSVAATRDSRRSPPR